MKKCSAIRLQFLLLVFLVQLKDLFVYTLRNNHALNKSGAPLIQGWSGGREKVYAGPAG